MFSDSKVCEFFGRSKQPSSPDAASTSMSFSQNDRPLVYRRVESTPPNENLMPCASSSGHAVVWEMYNDGRVDQCTQTDDQSFDSVATSYSTGVSPPAHNNGIADSNVLFQTGSDTTVPSHSVTDVDSRVIGINGDGLSAFCHSLQAHGDVVGACAEGTQNVGLWRRFDNNAWQVEQEKLKQMSLDLPAESESKDDQLPDLSSSNRLSVAALRLYDSIYSGQSTSSAHRVPPARSLCSMWMREQSQYAVHNADQLAGSGFRQNSERGPCPAIHRTHEAECHLKSSDAYNHSVCESGIGNYQSSSYIPQSQLVQQMSSAEHLPVEKEKFDYTSETSDGIPETFGATDDVSVGLAAEVISQLGLSERDIYGTDSSYVDNYRLQTSVTPIHVPYSDASQTAAEDAASARRPSIRELKSRFEAETSCDVSAREPTRLPSSSAAARHRQVESASLKVGRRSFHGRTDRESGQKQRRKPSLDTDVIVSASYSADNSSKDSAPKGRFVTRSSIAANAVVNLPVLSSEADIDQAEHRQFERLVDRRKVFEAANTQPVS